MNFIAVGSFTVCLYSEHVFTDCLKQYFFFIPAKSDGKERLTVTDTKAVPLTDESNADDALAAMLDKDLQPPPPINNNPVSEEIHQQHIILTKKFLTLNEKRVYANQRKAELLRGMDSDGKQNREEILRKRREIVSFLSDLFSQFANQVIFFIGRIISNQK